MYRRGGPLKNEKISKTSREVKKYFGRLKKVQFFNLCLKKWCFFNLPTSRRVKKVNHFKLSRNCAQVKKVQ